MLRIRPERTIRLIVGDLAGTFVDPGCHAPIRAIRETFMGFDIKLSTKDIREFTGKSKRQHIHCLTQLDDVRHQWYNLYGMYPGEKDVDVIYKKYEVIQYKHLQNIPMVPGCATTLRRLSTTYRCPIGATTGYSRRVIAPICQALQEEHLAIPIITCDDVKYSRPAPDGIFALMDIQKNYDTRSVIKIGDTQEDIIEGRQAGVWTIGLVNSSNYTGLTPKEFQRMQITEPEKLRNILTRTRHKLKEVSPDYIVDEISDVPLILRNILERIQTGE